MLKLFQNKKINFTAGFVLAGLIIGLAIFIVFGSDLYNFAYSTPAPPPAPPTTQSEGEFRMAATPCYDTTYCANDTACVDIDDLCKATTGGGIGCYSNCDLNDVACYCCCEATGIAATACASGYYQTNTTTPANTWIAATGSCCGDDASEVYEECVQRVAGEMAWACTSSQNACCTAASCVYSTTCKAAGIQTGLGTGADNVAYCYSTGYTWYDCDMNASATDSYCDSGEWCFSLETKEEAKTGEISTAFGEYASNDTNTECCGDDAGESYEYRSCAAGSPCTTSTADKACCNATTDCVFDEGLVNNYHCLAQGYCYDGGGEWAEKGSCSNSIWTDPDTNSTVCGYCSGAAWVAGGESAAFGEYDTGTSTECCTDDASENYKTGGIGSPTVACCNLSTDCVESGICQATGYTSTSNCQSICNRALCSSGSWTGSACAGSVTCSAGSCTEICEADCTADTWADAKTRGSSSCGAGGTLGCPSGSRCCAGNGTYGISCKAYDDDNASAICTSLDARTWTTVTTGDLETDSSNCTAGVTYCGDGTASNGFCCGDDTSENYRTGGIGTGTVACCDAATDCVEDGLCRATGYLSTSTCQSTCNRYLCSSGSWTGSACSGSVTCSGGSCTNTCSSTCGSDTWANTRTRGTCAAGGTNGCPSGSRCCAGNGTYGTSCASYDDDNSSAICTSLDARTWTTVTTGDLETDSSNCTAGVTYCGDGTASNGFCCGDDTNENYVTQGVGTAACCDSASDCVDSGNVCRTEWSTEVTCSDGIDNDCDDLIDAADPNCVSYTPKSQNWRWYDDEWDCDSSVSTHDAGQTCPNSVNGAALAAENTVPTGVGKLNAIKLRITINETAGAAGTDVKMRVQYASKVGASCGDDESFSYVAAQGAITDPWRYYNATAGTNDTDNTTLGANRLTDSGSNLATHNEVGDSATTFDHTASTAFEWEFAIQNYNGTANISYCFRIYNNTNAAVVPTNTGETYPELTTASAYDLSMDAPTSAAMPNYQLGSGTSGSNSNQFTDKDISVWDRRGTGAGWALTATSIDWTSASDTIINDDIDWTTDTIKALYAENTSCASNVGVCAGSGAFSGSVTLMDADADTSGPSAPGWGGYLIDAWTLRVNNIDARKTGTYQGTISFSLT